MSSEYELSDAAIAFAADEFQVGYNTALADAAIKIGQMAFENPYPNDPSATSLYWYGWVNAIVDATHVLRMAALPDPPHPNPCECDDCLRRIAFRLVQP